MTAEALSVVAREGCAVAVVAWCVVVELVTVAGSNNPADNEAELATKVVLIWSIVADIAGTVDIAAAAAVVVAAVVDTAAADTAVALVASAVASVTAAAVAVDTAVDHSSCCSQLSALS